MNKIHLLTTKSRKDVCEETISIWESYGWEIDITYNDNKHPSFGRNKILRKFYDSNEDWLCMADDDVYILNEEQFKNHGNVKFLGDVDLPKLNYKKFLTDNDEIFNYEYAPTAFMGTHINKIGGMFTSKRLRDAYLTPEYDNNWVFERVYKFAQLYFIQNIKKKYNKEIFQDTTLEAAEDWDFAMQLVDKGFTTAWLTNIIQAEVTTRSQLFEAKTQKASTELRQKALKQGRDIIIKKYKGMTIDKKGGLNSRKWIKHSWNPPTYSSGIGSPWTSESPPRLMIRGN